MKKNIVFLLLLLLLVTALAGIDESIKKKFDKAKVYKAKEIEVVKVEVMKPDIERYQKKTETDLSSGFFQFYKKNIRATNRILLNKWLKEFK